VPTILITGHGDKESAIRAVEAGAFAFFEKPFDLVALEFTVVRGAERHVLEAERRDLLAKLERLCKLQSRELEVLNSKESSPFIGESAAIDETKSLLARLSKKPLAPLLILGETGTGKEVVARELHRLTHGESNRAPFLALNCAAIPTELLESELYGHEKGSFSGAQTTRIGLAEAARDGTLFLDEIGDMDPRHQAKLLRLLQERKFRRVGSNNEIDFTGRIVAATHRDLKKFAETERFREDLYYRLSVISVVLPPLRERGTDIQLLAEKLCTKHGLRGLAPERWAEIVTYRWPGNIRELNNWIERAAILGLHDDEGLLTAPMPGVSEATAAVTDRPTLSFSEGLSIKQLREQLMDEYDRRWIEQALDKNRGNISAAAKALGLDRKNLAKRMKDLGLGSAKKAA
jgi:DNA-binding NtrC family response regulator